MKTQNYLSAWEPHFKTSRAYLLSLGFRMSGSLSEAEDIVQDAFIACQSVDPASIENHRAWLTRVCSNKALDALKVAHKKREAYIGVWLPDAVPDSFQFWSGLEDQSEPGDELLKKESLTTSFLLLLQKLSPEERVVYLLADIFHYSFREIAEFLEKSQEACKKISQRARKAIDDHKRFRSDGVASEKVIHQFFELAKLGDAKALAQLLAPDSEFWPDSGGKVPTASKSVIKDLRRTSRFFAGIWSSKGFNSEYVKEEYHQINGRPGLIISSYSPEEQAWRIDTILSFEVENGRISRIYSQRNPDKLASLLNLAGNTTR